MEYSVMKKIILFVCALCLWSCGKLGLTMDPIDMFENYYWIGFENKSTKQLVFEVCYVDSLTDPCKIEFVPQRDYVQAEESIYLPVLQGDHYWKYLFEHGWIGDTILVAIDDKWEDIEKWEKTLDKSFVDTVLILTEKEAPQGNFWEVIYKPE